MTLEQMPVPAEHNENEDCNCEQIGYAKGWNAALQAARRAEPEQVWIRWAVIDPDGEPGAFVRDRNFAQACASVDNKRAQSLGQPTGYHVMQVTVAPQRSEQE